MTVRKIWRRRLALLLTLALLLAPALQVSAEGLPEELVTDGSENPEIPGALEQQEQPGEPEQPEEPEAPIEPEQPEQPEEPEQPGEPEEPEQPKEPGQPEEPEEPKEPEEPQQPEQPEIPEEPEEPEISEEPEEAESSALWSLSRPLAIADVLSLPSGEEPVLTGGTVVFVEGLQAVLQDETGGIRLSFSEPPEMVPGDVLLVSGHRSDGLAVLEFEKTGTGVLPVLEAALSEGRDGVRILVRGAVLGAGSLTQNGHTCLLKGTLPEGFAPGDRVDAWGVLLDGEFYADTVTALETPVLERSLTGSWNFYFGQLHAHTDISDGRGSVETAFAHARQVKDLDFLAITDHSNSFDHAMEGSLNADGSAISGEWAAGKAAAKGVTDETFVGIFGYEMTWPGDLAIGHINTFGTSGWLTRDQPGMNTLSGYLDALAAAPDSVSQFNHPGGSFGNFQSFQQYTPQHDARVHLLEVTGETPFDAYGAYVTALDRGWHLAPSNNQNNHDKDWGSASQGRTVVLARELSENAVYDAVRNYRVYATEDADLQIEYRLNGQIMGSILGGGETLTADISLADGSGDAIGTVEVITGGGERAASATIQEPSGTCSLDISSGGSYYFVRILRSGKTVAVTAPVWVDAYDDLGIADFTAKEAKPVQGTQAQLTLTLFNRENLPFVVESVTFSAGSQVIEQVEAPGSVASLGELEIPLTYMQESAGAVTITAAVTGTIGSLPRSYQKTVTLHYQPLQAERLPIGQVRNGMLGEAYRIRGYVTAGTSNPHNTFPGSIYLQDDSGGIQITDFTREGIQLGAPMEIEGILRSAGGNLVLAMTDYQVLQEDYYRYVPVTMAHGEAMDYEAHGGQLLQIEGHVVSLTKTADQKGVSRFTIRDVMGDLATVVIESSIGSGAYGTNELVSEIKTSRMVRAMGLLHIDEYGKTVLRVRNCDEVVYVPPRKDPTNPQTGDWLLWLKSRK